MFGQGRGLGWADGRRAIVACIWLTCDSDNISQTVTFSQYKAVIGRHHSTAAFILPCAWRDLNLNADGTPQRKSTQHQRISDRRCGQPKDATPRHAGSDHIRRGLRPRRTMHGRATTDLPSPVPTSPFLAINRRSSSVQSFHFEVSRASWPQHGLQPRFHWPVIIGTHW